MKQQPKIYKSLLPWFKVSGRHNLPWQVSKSPYTVWISETMLQQTQVATVIPYYLKFIQKFPAVEKLAAANEDEVLALWSGLGYYSRARNLHKSAKIIANDLQNEFPNDLESLKKLPGIGPSTAAAILSLAFDIKSPILDGNVKRVLCRYHGIEAYPEEPKIKKMLWEFADHHMSESMPADYTQAIMDLGATVCTKSAPNCTSCPIQKNCICFEKQAFEQIPKPKPSKKIPIKELHFAVISFGDHILLQKRPQSGIWAGLWSFIESPSQEEQAVELAKLPIEICEHSKLIKFNHTLTHLKMKIIARIYRAEEKFSLAENQIWFRDSNQHKIGISKPVRLILNQLLEAV